MPNVLSIEFTLIGMVTESPDSDSFTEFLSEIVLEASKLDIAEPMVRDGLSACSGSGTGADGGSGTGADG